MKIAIVHNAIDENSTPDERDVLVQVAAVSRALTQLGHESLSLPVDIDLAAFKREILRIAPDVVFNLVESLDCSDRLIGVVPSLLSAMGVAYTGSPAETIHLTSHKVLAKGKMQAAGLPTPAWIGPYPYEFCSICTPAPGTTELQGPWIVKSVWEHGSMGISGDGLLRVERPDELIEAGRQRAPRLGGACFAEQFIDGREFNLSILAGPEGPVVLPPAEIMFDGYVTGKPRIVCYQAKWDETSFEYTHTSRRFDFPEYDAPLLSALADAAKRCWQVFDLRGYARVDFRVDEDGRIWILEINANPCLSPDAGFAAAVAQSGKKFADAVADILNDAVAGTEQRYAAAPIVGPENATDAAVTPGPQPLLTGDPGFRYEPCGQDIAQVRDLITATGYFHSYEVDVAVELVADRLAKGETSEYFFVFLESDGRLIGYSCFGPIACTRFGYDIYWIAVQPDLRRQGIGRRILNETERLIANAGGRRIYIDTSESETYQSTRAFYQRCGYRFESILKDFYAPGDGKVICCKILEE